MTIEQAVIDAIKTEVDLVSLVEAKGIKLKKNGQSYFGLCPFHGDKTPSLSINPHENLWQCFGCGEAGGVIRFVELFDRVGFPEAVRRLTNSPTVRREQQEPPPPALRIKDRKLLPRVIDLYHSAFFEDPRARKYLESRGITDKALYRAHKIGFADGRLIKALPTEGEVVDQLKLLGVLSAKGHEHFAGYVTFPLYSPAGYPAGIYGRAIPEVISGNIPDHLYLPGERFGLFNHQAAKTHKDIILTESVIDSLTLMGAGIRNTIPCYGTNGLTAAHLQWFKRCGVETVQICFDGDEMGGQAAEKAAGRLESEGLNVHRIDLPLGQDLNDFFTATARAKPAFKRLMTAAARRATPPAKQPKEKRADEKKTEPGTDGYTAIENWKIGTGKLLLTFARGCVTRVRTT